MGTRYETDIVAWANEQAALLRSGQLSAIDIEHIADPLPIFNTLEPVLRRTLSGNCTKRGKEMNEIDTGIRHITKSGTNIFAELGFKPVEAERYQAESQKQISATYALKEQLMNELTVWIKDNHLKQEQAAEILHITRPRVSDVVNKKVAKFTIDALVSMLLRIGKPVTLAIG
jgi:predicted XRE-type DNA-binding protein